MSKSFDLKNYLETRRQWVDEALDRYLPAADQWPEKLNESVRYSMFAGGKRLRPILALGAAEAAQKDPKSVLPVACALEMIHTYSLIHDDLPAMDDDDLRRGRPTNHKVYGEAIAILAGDSLLTQAFHTIVQHSQNGNSEKSIRVLDKITQAAGSRGMVGGQVQDLLSEKKKITQEELENLHRHKTGALIQVSLEVGAISSGATEGQIQALSQFGACIGLSFQIADDLLDIEGGEEIGKDVGSDLEKEKATYPSIVGVEESRALAKKLTQEALEALKVFEESADPLREIAKYVVYRKN
ncbi:MAG: polyprenyl synthetase family protein [bacterium]|nr:polyprenyl synthetase family protein [bacterium]